MAKNTGKEYENFVKTIQETILNLPSSDLLPNKRMTIELNKIINGREFDLYWEFEYGGVKYRNVIECKDYASNISVEKIDAFLGKTRDIPDLRLIYATKTGYQSGAIERAKQYNISLLKVRECNDEDFIAEDGTLLIRHLEIKKIMIPSPRIISFSLFNDGSWLKSQPNLNQEKINNRIKESSFNEDMFFNDKITNKQYSLLDLQNSLKEISPNIEYIKMGTYSKKFENCFVECKSDNFKFKIKGFDLTYEYSRKLVETNLNIDLTNQVFGIIYNQITGKKQIIFNNKKVKDLN